MIQLVSAASLGVARPALRLGGEWAGWKCAFNPRSGAVITDAVKRYCSDEMIEWDQVPFGFEVCTTETWDGNPPDSVLNRRLVQLLPEDGCNTENLSAIVARATLAKPISGTNELAPGQGLEVDVLNTRAWALDAAISESLWRCEAIFDGIGGIRPRMRRNAVECPAERTRVEITFDPATGELATKEPVVICQERCWMARPSADFQVREGGGRSGLDAAWVSSVVGLGCFAEQPPIEDRDGILCLPGGIEVHAQPGLLEVVLDQSVDGTEKKVLLRRSWVGSSRFVEVVVSGEAQTEFQRDSE